MRRALPYQALGFLFPVILPHTLASTPLACLDAFRLVHQIQQMIAKGFLSEIPASAQGILRRRVDLSVVFGCTCLQPLAMRGPADPRDRLRLGRRCRVTGESDERDRALAKNRENQHQKAGQACLGELQMRLEEFAKSLHYQSGDLGIVDFCVHNQWITPQVVIC
jgi:hypothetical protein